MEEVSREALAKVEAIFASLAEQMGVATEHFWPLFVRQQLIEGIVGVVSIFIANAVGVSLALQLRKVDRKGPHEDPRAFVGAIGVGVILVALAGTVIAMPTLASNIFNPEYAALKDVIEMVKP